MEAQTLELVLAHSRSVSNQERDAFNWRGNAFSDIGQNDQAIQDFNQAIKLNLRYVNAFINCEVASLHKKDCGLLPKKGIKSSHVELRSRDPAQPEFCGRGQQPQPRIRM